MQRYTAKHTVKLNLFDVCVHHPRNQMCLETRVFTLEQYLTSFQI